MKTLNCTLFVLMLLAAGCVSSQRMATTEGRAQIGYPESILALRLAQDEQSADLVLTLANLSSSPITNFFPQNFFEGSIWIIQEGRVPLQTYTSNYFQLRMASFWANPETVIPVGSKLTYRIPLESLVCPWSSREPDWTRPVLAYAFMDGLKAVSNVIPLKNGERIPWRESWMKQTGSGRHAEGANETSTAGGGGLVH